VPIENSLAGSVVRNYELLSESPFSVAAEVYLRIRHNLITRPGVRLAEITHVYSHPVALAQCQRFIAEHHLDAVAAYDTAGSVKQLMTSLGRNTAAIAGRWAAQLYGGDIVAENIEDHSENYTRFLLLVRPEEKDALPAAGPLKTSLVFRTVNRPGALHQALAAFAVRNVNLTKIESRPIAGKPWEYSFYVDVSGGESDPPVGDAVAELRGHCEYVRILGSYPAGELPS
jgi:prephenate dehydratase